MNRASRVPTLVLATTHIALGICWLVAGRARFSAPRFAELQQVLPARGWGALFLAAGVLILGAVVGGHRSIAYAGLSFGLGLLLVWAVLLGYAAAHIPFVDWSGAVVYAALAVIHVPSGLRLLTTPALPIGPYPTYRG